MNVSVTTNRSGEGSQAVKRRASRGFSLIEVIIAAAIVAIIFSIVFTGIRTTFSLEGATRENLRATQIIVSRMEGLRLCAWSSDQLFNTNVVPPTFSDWFYPLGLQGTTNYGTHYTGTITVTTNCNFTPAATYAGNLALITVTVNWTNNQGTATAHTRSMSTLVAKYGVQNYIYGH